MEQKFIKTEQVWTKSDKIDQNQLQAGSKNQNIQALNSMPFLQVAP